MNNLLDRGLIECKGRLDVPGRPMLYGTTHDFLRSFGLDSLDSLPATTEELIAVFENAKTDTGLDPAAFEAQNEGLINEATATQKTIDDIEGELEAEATVEAVSEDVTELDDMGADDDLANDIE